MNLKGKKGDRSGYRRFFNIFVLVIGGLFLAIQPVLMWTTSGGALAKELPSSVLTAVLAAPGGGVNPHGSAEYSVYPSGNRELEVEIEDVNLADGVSLSIFLNDSSLGTAVLSGRKAKLKLATENGQAIPAVKSSDIVNVKNGATVLLSGTFTGSGTTPTPTGSPTATPTGSPTVIPSPTPTATPGEVQSFANLTGGTINGVLPHGYAQYEIHSQRTEIEVKVRQVNLPVNTALAVLIDNTNVGQIILQNGGEGSLRLRSDKGQTVPIINPGSTITVQNNGSPALAGVFGIAGGPTPTPGTTPSPSPTPQQGRFFEAHLTGAQLSPTVTTAATGEVKILLNADETQATVTGEFHNLSSAQTGGAIEAQVGTVSTFYTFPVKNSVNGEFAPAVVSVSAEQVAQLRAGIFFAFIASANNPAGEIGGRLISHSEHSDFDGDGNNDLAVYRPSNGVWYSLNGSGFNALQLGGADDKVVSADYDGDGRTDQAVYKNVNGQAIWQIARSSDGGVTTQNWGLATDIPVRGDFDGDGRSDLAVYRPSNGVWYILNSDNSGYHFVGFGDSTDIPLAADMNGDGRDDIVVFRPSTGNWYWLLSGSDQFVAGSWGMAGDKPIAGDFDGDGKADLTVYRPSNGAWYVYRSSDGALQADAFGAGDDIPVAGNYDGDNKTDVAVYRPSTGIWYVLHSSDHSFHADGFGSPGDIPAISQ